ncbi:MAG: hypothetical protein ABWX59_06640 [Microbacteriaceae bacterium]
MQWWNNFVNWLLSDDGWRVFSTAILPFIAIVLAGLIAALIGRRMAERVLAFQDRELKASAVAALIGAGRKAAVWSTLTVQEQAHFDNQISESDARVRLLPVSGSALAADWAAHQLVEMKKNSAIFSFQADQTLDEFRDRLIEWQHRPSRAKKLFKQDLEQWKYAQPSPEQELSVQQQEWAASNRAVEVAAAALPADRYSVDRHSTAEPRDVTPAVPPVTLASSSPTAETPAPLAPAVTPQPAVTESVPSPVEPKPYATSDLDSYSPPVTASTVRQRINPPTDD